MVRHVHLQMVTDGSTIPHHHQHQHSSELLLWPKQLHFHLATPLGAGANRPSVVNYQWTINKPFQTNGQTIHKPSMDPELTIKYQSINHQSSTECVYESAGTSRGFPCGSRPNRDDSTFIIFIIDEQQNNRSLVDKNQLVCSQEHRFRTNSPVLPQVMFPWFSQGTKAWCKCEPKEDIFSARHHCCLQCQLHQLLSFQSWSPNWYSPDGLYPLAVSYLPVTAQW